MSSERSSLLILILGGAALQRSDCDSQMDGGFSR
jgi:hypothetical protein